MLKTILVFISLISYSAYSANKADLKMLVDNKQSVVTWTGKKVTGEHTGNITLTKGEIIMKNDHLSGGNFEIDMNSITNADLKDKEWNDKLVKHLKHEDFFHVSKHKKAKLVIKNVIFGKGGIYNVMADLTIRGITKPILFDAELESLKDKTILNSKIVFNRADFGLKFRSGKFFDPKALGDKLIYDDVQVDVKLVALKK